MSTVAYRLRPQRFDHILCAWGQGRPGSFFGWTYGITQSYVYLFWIVRCMPDIYIYILNVCRCDVSFVICTTHGRICLQTWSPQLVRYASVAAHAMRQMSHARLSWTGLISTADLKTGDSVHPMHTYKWVFPKIGVSPKWMVYKVKPY